MKKYRNPIIAIFTLVLIIVFAKYLYWKNVENYFDQDSKQVADVTGTSNWKTFTSKFGMSIKYPEGWSIGDSSYEWQGQKQLFVWVYGPKRNAPLAYESNQAKFMMSVCYRNDLKIFAVCDEPRLFYPGGVHAPNTIELSKEAVLDTDEYKIAIKIMATATLY